jgi:MFS family permease
VSRTARLRQWLQTALASLASNYASLKLLSNRNLALLATVNLLDSMSVSLVVPLLPLYADALGAGPPLIGLIFVAESLAMMVFSTPVGYISDHLDRRVPIVAGTLLSGASVIAFGGVESAVLLVGLRGIDGIATALRGPQTTAYIGETFPEAERASAISAYRSAGMVGFAVGPAIGGGLATLSNLAIPFVVLGSGTVAGGVLLVFLPPVASSDDESESEEPEPNLRELSAAQFRSLVSIPVVGLSLSYFIAQLAAGLFYPFLAVLFETTLSMGAGYTGAVWSVFGASLLVFMPLGGTLADATGRKRSIVAGKLLWGVAGFGLAVATIPAIPPLLVLAIGLGSALFEPALSAASYEHAPDAFSGTLLGFYGTLAAAGAALGPLIGGVILQWTNVRMLFVALGSLWLLDTLIIGLSITETRQNDT